MITNTNPLIDERKCFNCMWYNGTYEDDAAFCDDRDEYAPKNGWCYRWKKKEQ